MPILFSLPYFLSALCYLNFVLPILYSLFFSVLPFFYFLFCQPGSRPGPDPSANPSSGLPPMVTNLPPPIANLPPMATNLPPMASTIPPGSSTLPLMPAMPNAFSHPLTPTLSPSPSPLNVSFFFSFCFLLLQPAYCHPEYNLYFSQPLHLPFRQCPG